ncbi:MAG: hypothetical protein F6K35_50580 [Okeania sp. SIO2H7]|nr:hypothetical protein [Okeania sp. SIO2H7]
MNVAKLVEILTDLFAPDLSGNASDGWVIKDNTSQLLVLLSEDQSWLRIFISIAPEREAQPYIQQLLRANFDDTQETRYALSNDVLWGVYQHDLESLSEAGIKRAIARLIYLKEQGLKDCFQATVEHQVRQIIWASKKQGQSLEATLQTLERFYAEGMLGGLEQSKEEKEAFLRSWRYQLQRLWNEVEVS